MSTKIILFELKNDITHTFIKFQLWKRQQKYTAWNLLIKDLFAFLSGKEHNWALNFRRCKKKESWLITKSHQKYLKRFNNYKTF